MIHPVVCNTVLNPKVGILNPSRWGVGKCAPSGAILYWDASAGWQDQTGNQSLTLIGSAYPTVTAAGAVNASDGCCVGNPLRGITNGFHLWKLDHAVLERVGFS